MPQQRAFGERWAWSAVACYCLKVDFAGAAAALSRDLSLDSPPVALAFIDTPPEGVATADAPEPSSCSFWRRAEAGPIFADAQAHMRCPVGAMVMGFELSESAQQDLMAAAELMIGCGYLEADEVPKLPTIQSARAGVLYAPLADFPTEPDLVLLWLSPREAMRFAEAAGSCTWGQSTPAGLLGRPACAVLPTALTTGAATLSLGCAGMRTFTEISGDRLLGTIPGTHLETFVATLERTLQANAAMQQYYDSRKAAVASLRS